MKEFIAWLKWLYTPVKPATADPNCQHCRGVGYDASGFPCTCLKERE